MLHVVYRSYGGENKKGRPAYYSKLLSLISFLRARASYEESGAKVDVVYLNDGPIPADRLALMERSGEIVAGKSLGNRGSLRLAYRLPELRGWAPEDLILYAEDDYLFTPDALKSFAAASDMLPSADYLALYALIGTRPPQGGSAPDYAKPPPGWHDSEPVQVEGHAWRRALSTTSSFGVRVRVMREDRALHRAVMYSGGAWDHTTCLLLQGFPLSSRLVTQCVREATSWSKTGRGLAIAAVRLALNGWHMVRPVPPRLIVASDPALATHVEDGQVAEGRDWAKQALDSATWGIRAGLVAPSVFAEQVAAVGDMSAASEPAVA